MKSKIITTFAVAISCLCLILTGSANGQSWSSTLEYNQKLSKEVTLGVDFYTRINASSISDTKPVIKTTNKIKKALLFWVTITESEDTISQTNKNYNNYWSYEKSVLQQVTWKNIKDSSSISGRFEANNG